MLIENNITHNIIVLTTEHNSSVQHRCHKLSLQCIPTSGRKIEVFNDLVFQFKSYNPGKITTVYLGNDLNDLDCLAASDISACPADADKAVLRASSLRLKSAGGKGCVRELLLWYSRHYRLDIWRHV